MNPRHKQIALKTLKIFGYSVLFTTISVLAPKFPYLVLKEYLRREFNKDYSQTQLESTIKYLKNRKFIAYSNGEFKITKVGQKHLETALTKELFIPKIKW